MVPTRDIPTSSVASQAEEIQAPGDDGLKQRQRVGAGLELVLPIPPLSSEELHRSTGAYVAITCQAEKPEKAEEKASWD